MTKNYGKEISYSIEESSLPISEIDRIKWINSIRAVYECTLEEASKFLSNIRQVRFSKREETFRLTGELRLRKIEIKIKKTVANKV